ncbi:hypothetical protein BU15DRAFT_80792 [Melanogaster broomeanus]|nr:hypothetical protein BU15DRAFT_80792 [Melanogaster broomeanus]
MSYETQSILAGIQLNDYTSVIIATAVGYDFTRCVLIEFVWKRPWSWVSTMFNVVRYVGCCNVMLAAFTSTTFEPGPVMTYVSTHLMVLRNVSIIFKISQGTVLSLIQIWMFPVFLGVADLLILLRVYAMYNRSRIVLAILLVIYIPSTVIFVIATGIYNDPKLYMSVTNPEVAGFKICVVTYNTTSLFGTYDVIPRIILGILLCGLAIAQFVRQSLQMHKAIKQWRSDRYMTLLVRESILYFLAYALLFSLQTEKVLTSFFRPASNLLYNIAPFVLTLGPLPVVGTALNIVDVFCWIFPFVLAPRFVISVRELCSCDVGGHVDTGFGVASQHVSHNTIVFAPAGEVQADDAEMAGGEVTAEVANECTEDRSAVTRRDTMEAAHA